MKKAREFDPNNPDPEVEKIRPAGQHRGYLVKKGRHVMSQRYSVVYAWAENVKGGSYVVYDHETKTAAAVFKYKKEIDRGVAHGRANLTRDSLNRKEGTQ